ncbi:hypothetical protein E1A91_D12G005900v1 [Gossypium mustelinum]|uniref:HMA domain-containing protein n=1 Tax=Gossypium mustelinum TaxID=34275 RepID=A0A5D2S9W4_GOSMU|nr:hypothetical protein E1A91_D12G005900v1 [Gossypium mustelinum]
MADDLNVPVFIFFFTCVLKVNIQCCATCPKKVKKKLQKINEVYDIDMDTKNGLVSVRGIIEPSILIQTIAEKVGKKAEVCSYEKNPKIQSDLLDQDNRRTGRKYEEKNQACSFTDECNVRDEAKDPISEGSKGSHSRHHPQHDVRKKKRGFASWLGKKSNGGHARLLTPSSAPSLPPSS